MSEIALTEVKAHIRKTVFAARKEVHGTGLDAAACARLAALLEQLPQECAVAGYMPIRTEVSPLLVMADLAGAGRRICVPVIQGDGLPLKFREWTPFCEMIDGPFGARVPALGDWLAPGILITPLVGFDRQGGRLGYGGGFYDRTLALLRRAGPALAVGFAYSAQEVAEVPLEPTDVPLDAVVTEVETMRISL